MPPDDPRLFSPNLQRTLEAKDRDPGQDEDLGTNNKFRMNAATIQGPREFDLTVGPRPDLIIEMAATSSSIPRLPIFAALGIPEICRIDGDVGGVISARA